MKRSGPPKRRTPLRRRSLSASAKARREAVEGPQWRLCHRTACVVKFAYHWRELYGDREIDWSQLPMLEEGEEPSEGHHEPTRARGGKDEDTLPLSAKWHRHSKYSRGNMPCEAFWAHHEIDWRAARDEMRRRTREV